MHAPIVRLFLITLILLIFLIFIPGCDELQKMDRQPTDAILKIDSNKYIIPAKHVVDFIKDKNVRAITGTGNGTEGYDLSFIVILEPMEINNED